MGNVHFGGKKILGQSIDDSIFLTATMERKPIDSLIKAVTDDSLFSIRTQFLLLAAVAAGSSRILVVLKLIDGC